ncbi:hypothetical protein JVT61DRAFT_7900 [Boletus reticuloceps]|uniref:Mitochondrial escape protein 2 n=1 Tax=Boletus reticuloceps TaxID=495285 RepID=A0A8I2YI22_9AGAM|nr:hypothetical protein JVT61DRAFT_7900 [Boletus reticuloceps]
MVKSVSDPPLTAAFVHGPQGSGKTHLVFAVLQDSNRKSLVIDYAELNKAISDSRLVAALSQQTGYSRTTSLMVTPLFTVYMYEQWVATLIENKIAHVVVVSDSREQAKLVTRAPPSKPLNFIPLYDADTGSVMAFVKQHLRDAGMTAELTKREVASIECLGGRASDLEIVGGPTDAVRRLY